VHLDFHKAGGWSKIFIGAAIGLPINFHEIALKTESGTLFSEIVTGRDGYA
jgi:hypothetical protein